MELVQGTPHPALRGSVLRYEGFAPGDDAVLRFRALPCSFAPLILEFGAEWQVADGRRPESPAARLSAFAAGLGDGPVLIESRGRTRCVQVDLTPIGARRLLGLPMHELANRSVDLRAVLGRAGDELVERLAEAPDWAGRFALVDRALLARLADAAPVDGAVAWSFERLAGSGGGAAIGDLARELGWSHRRLIVRFRDVVGLPPKRVARVLRFERLTALLDAPAPLDWARAAVELGYFDQSHLVREVRDLSGLSPTALRAEREGVNFVQDPAGLAA